MYLILMKTVVYTEETYVGLTKCWTSPSYVGVTKAHPNPGTPGAVLTNPAFGACLRLGPLGRQAEPVHVKRSSYIHPQIPLLATSIHNNA
jgi:hypothetical protein